MSDQLEAQVREWLREASVYDMAQASELVADRIRTLLAERVAAAEEAGYFRGWAERAALGTQIKSHETERQTGR